MKKYKEYHFCNIYKSAEIGANTKVGSYTEIGKNVKIGKDCIISAFCFMSEGVVLEDSVFVGPGTLMLNDKRPPSKGKEWGKILIKRGASIGGGVTILPDVVIGEKAIIGAGSVVTKNVPAGEVWLGSPAKLLENKSIHNTL